jgi:hypothetical protein
LSVASQKEKKLVDRVEANTEAAAPSRPLLLGERTLLISQATPADMASIGAVARKRARRDTPLGRLTGDPVFATLPPALQRDLLLDAGRVQAAGSGGVDPLAVADELLEPDTLSFAVYMLARQHHPDLNLAEVRALVSEDNAAEVWLGLSDASGMATLALKNLAGPSG